MKHILLIATGGTIASPPTENGLQPSLTVENLFLIKPRKWVDMESAPIVHAVTL